MGRELSAERLAQHVLLVPVYLSENVVLQPFTEYIVWCAIDNEVCNNTEYLFIPRIEKLSLRGIIAASAVVKAHEKLIPARIYNATAENIVLYEKTVVGNIEECVSVKAEEGYVRKTISQKSNHLDDLRRQINENDALSKTEKRATHNLLDRYEHIFSRNKDDIGYCPFIKHEILVKDDIPVHDSIRRIPMGLEEKVDDMVEKLLDQKIIRQSDSPWNAALVVVKKKDGSIRLCVDYRNLNAKTIRPIYPIPETKHLLDTLHGSKYFSAIDLSSAYYQCEVEEKDKQKTAFATRHGHYEFNRMPFGLCGAPATFQKIMHVILKNENWTSCLVYLDDVLIFGKDYPEHLHRIELIFQKFSDAGIKLSPNKCNFFQTELQFLGHMVTSEGIKPDPNKVAKVSNWPKPCSIEDLRSFLGFSNYYRRFIKNYSDLTRPLELMMKSSAQGDINKMKKKALIWTNDTDGAFSILKSKLTKAPILGYPNNKDMFVLDTDASHFGMGAVLSQRQNGTERVIEYASKKFTKSELRYCVTRKELLSVFTFITQFRHYLLGKPFLLRTDHRALLWMLNWDEPNTSQYCRWIAELEEYDFTVEHRPGKLHANADGLSRIFQCEQCQLSHQDPQKKRNVKVFKSITENKKYLELISKYHEKLGHAGITKILEIMNFDGYCWKGMSNDVRKQINMCYHCAERKEGRMLKNVQYKISSNYPFEKVMIDITGPLFPSSRQGHKFILGVIDVFSRYSMLIPLKETDSITIIDALFTYWFCIFGFPKYLISDNAANLSSTTMEEYCSANNIIKVNCSPYYPQGNGIIERLFRTVKDMIYATTKQRRTDWVKSIPYVEMGLRSTICKTTGFSPHEVIFGLRTPLPWAKSLDNVPKFSCVSEFIKQHEMRFSEISNLLQTHSQEDQSCLFQVGDEVMVKSVKEKGLLRPKFFGPCKVVQYCGKKVYELCYKGKLFLRNQFHLKPFSSVQSHMKNRGKDHSESNSCRDQTIPTRRYPERQRMSVKRYGLRN